MDATTAKQEQLYHSFVHALRTYKKRKREWQERMTLVLAEEEEDIRLRRQMLYAEYE